ncbi:MAG: hypothetical protein JWP73_2056 [Phenylobacterium sp.]|nr:hypothetical protein [Phenylobacterium sp.]
MRPAALALLSALLAASAAHAGQPAAADAPVASSPPPSVAEQIDAFIKASPVPALPQDAAPGATSTADDRKVHGVVELGVGSNGYRHAYIQSDMALGEHGSLSIAVDDTRFNGRFGQYRNQGLGIGLAFGEAARDGGRCRRLGEVTTPLDAPSYAISRPSRICSDSDLASPTPR